MQLDHTCQAGACLCTAPAPRCMVITLRSAPPPILPFSTQRAAAVSPTRSAHPAAAASPAASPATPAAARPPRTAAVQHTVQADPATASFTAGAVPAAAGSPKECAVCGKSRREGHKPLLKCGRCMAAYCESA